MGLALARPPHPALFLALQAMKAGHGGPGTWLSLISVVSVSDRQARSSSFLFIFSRLALTVNCSS